VEYPDQFVDYIHKVMPAKWVKAWCTLQGGTSSWSTREHFFWKRTQGFTNDTRIIFISLDQRIHDQKQVNVSMHDQRSWFWWSRYSGFLCRKIAAWPTPSLSLVDAWGPAIFLTAHTVLLNEEKYLIHRLMQMNRGRGTKLFHPCSLFCPGVCRFRDDRSRLNVLNI
jgi:hypothetical protein